jgi:pyruvate ferredoxin oxidoreductase gamma subunit
MAVAAINLGKYAQAFPSFGPERRGAPVVAFCRIDDKKIRLRTNIYNPDLVVVLDSSLPKIVNVTAGLKKDGILIINAKQSCSELRQTLGFTGRLAAVDATHIAREETGVPITNVTMLGALLKACEVIAPAALPGPIEKRFGRIAEKNIRAFHRALVETELSL